MDGKYIETQKYSECQLVAVINAAIKLGELPVWQGEYERLVDLVGARYGGATSIDYAVRYFRLVARPIPIRQVVQSAERGDPVILSTRTPRHGGHCVAVVGARRSRRGVELRVPNFKYGRNGWVRWVALRAFISPSIRLGHNGKGGKKVGHVLSVSPLHNKRLPRPVGKSWPASDQEHTITTTQGA
jgi:hypothetical protein